MTLIDPVGNELTMSDGAGKTRIMRYRLTIEPDEDGVFVAECPSLPGCISQGKTREAAIANIRDAIQGYIASLEKHNEPVPLPITEEIIEV